MPRPRLTYATTAVLQALAGGCGYGFDVMDATGLPSGTVYPVLRRLEKEGLVRSRWEDEAAARRGGRPRRRYYEVTARGSETLATALERFRLLVPPAADPRPDTA